MHQRELLLTEMLESYIEITQCLMNSLSASVFVMYCCISPSKQKTTYLKSFLEFKIMQSCSNNPDVFKY